MNEAKYIWMDGKLIDWKDAKVHILTHTVHYGNAVFEGTRAYQTEDGLAIFRLDERCKRLYNSAKIVAVKPNMEYDVVKEAHLEVLRSNDFTGNVYMRPIIFLGYGQMGVHHVKAPVQTAVAAWEWGAYLGEDGLENGIKVCTSSITRNPNGFEEALMLDENGFAAEGTGECLFIVRDGVLISPPNDNSLESITQATVLELAKEAGIPIERRNITRDEIYICDEAFFTGTAAEVTPINSLDHRVVGNGARGPMTEQLQSAYFDVVFGRNPKYKHYLTYI